MWMTIKPMKILYPFQLTSNSPISEQKFWFVGLKLVFKHVLVSTRFTSNKQMNSMKYEWYQEDKLAYNSLLFGERQIQMQA